MESWVKPGSLLFVKKYPLIIETINFYFKEVITMLNYGLEETIKAIDSMEDYEIESFLNNWEKIIEKERTYNELLDDIGRFGYFQYKTLVICHARRVLSEMYLKRREEEIKKEIKG